MNNAESPALYAFHVYGTLVEDDDALAFPTEDKEADASVYSLSGIKQERRSLKPGLYIVSGKVVYLKN